MSSHHGDSAKRNQLRRFSFNRPGRHRGWHAKKASMLEMDGRTKTSKISQCPKTYYMAFFFLVGHARTETFTHMAYQQIKRMSFVFVCSCRRALKPHCNTRTKKKKSVHLKQWRLSTIIINWWIFLVWNKGVTAVRPKNFKFNSFSVTARIKQATIVVS